MRQTNHDHPPHHDRLNPLSAIAVPGAGAERDAYLEGIAEAVVPAKARRTYFEDMAHRIVAELLHAAVAKAYDQRDFDGIPQTHAGTDASIGMIADWLEESTRPGRGRDWLAEHAMKATGGKASSVMSLAAMGEREASGVATTAITALWRADDAFARM